MANINTSRFDFSTVAVLDRPIAGSYIIAFDLDGKLKKMDHAGVITVIEGSGGGGAIPIITTVQRDSIPTPTEALLIYNTDISKFQYYTNSTSPAGWETIESGEWHVNASKDITGLTTLDMTNTVSADSFDITSSNPTETVNAFVSGNKKFRIYPNAGLTLTITHGVTIKCAGGVSAVLIGTNSDWIEFEMRNGKYLQAGGETY